MIFARLALASFCVLAAFVGCAPPCNPSATLLITGQTEVCNGGAYMEMEETPKGLLVLCVCGEAPPKAPAEATP